MYSQHRSLKVTGLLKICGGSLRGRRIQAPKGADVRPTLEKTRDALFNVITSRYEIDRFTAVDLFAGTGALGFEALSRGAERAVFVEKNAAHCSMLEANIRQLKLDDRCDLFRQDALAWIKKRIDAATRYLFLVDPPYATTLAQATLDRLSACQEKLESSLVVLETARSQSMTIPGCFKQFQEKTYGDTRLLFLESLSRGTL